MASEELIAAITDAIGETEVALRKLLQEKGLQVVKTNYSHSANLLDKIDGTQKKGFICRLGEPEPLGAIQRALKAICVSVLIDVENCPGSNCYLLNFLNVEFKTYGGKLAARVALRGCPAIAPEGFNFALASAELTADPSLLSGPRPYGWELFCHPSFVKDAPDVVEHAD